MVATTATIPARMTQKASGPPSPGKSTFIPNKPVITVSGSIVTLMIVSSRRTSFWRWEMADSFVASSASTTSL